MRTLPIMTNAEAKAFVIGRFPGACLGITRVQPTEELFWYSWDGIEDRPDLPWGMGKSQGRAWKFAAQAIKAAEGGATS